MNPMLAKLLVFSLLFGTVEAGFDLASVVTPGDLGAAHEIHSHLGTDSESPDGADNSADHYCHCGTHAPVLNSLPELSSQAIAENTYPIMADSYHSLKFRPALRPPKI